MATVFEGRPKIYANAAGVGMPYPNGGFPMPDANAPEALKARQNAIDRRLRAGPAPTAAAPTAAAPTAAAPTAAAAAEPMPKTGTLRRLAQMPGQAFDFVKAAPGKVAGMLDANVGKGVASVVQGTANSLTQGVGRVLAPIGFGAQALQTADTPTEEYSRRTGIEGGSLRGDLLARGIGTLQDIGNNATFGVADRLGNLIAGNGFNRSAGNQVGEIGRPGQEVGGVTPVAAAPQQPFSDTRSASLAAAAPPPASPNNIVRNGNSYSGGNVTAGANIVNPDGSQRQSGGVIRNQDVSLTFDENGRTTGSTQGTLRGGGTVSSLDTSEGYRQNLLELQRNAAERAAQNPTQVADAPAVLRGRRAERANRLQVATMNNATQRRINDQNNATTLRGQDLDLEGKMVPIRVAQQQRALISSLLQANGGDPAAAARAALAAGRVDLAETLSKPVATMQEQAGKRDGLQKSAWDDIRTGITAIAPAPDKAGNPEVSKALEERAFARFKRSNPEGYNLQGAGRQKALQTAMADEELMAVFEKPEDGGFASMLPLRMDSPTRKMNDLPPASFFKGARLGEQVGGLRGALSPNMSKGDQVLDLGSGRQSVNVGNLSAGALARLQSMIDEANGQAGK